MHVIERRCSVTVFHCVSLLKHASTSYSRKLFCVDKKLHSLICIVHACGSENTFMFCDFNFPFTLWIKQKPQVMRFLFSFTLFGFQDQRAVRNVTYWRRRMGLEASVGMVFFLGFCVFLLKSDLSIQAFKCKIRCISHTWYKNFV